MANLTFYSLVENFSSLVECLPEFFFTLEIQKYHTDMFRLQQFSLTFPETWYTFSICRFRSFWSPGMFSSTYIYESCLCSICS